MSRIALFLLLVLCNFSYADVERRAVIDVGSGGTKFTIAEIDTQTKQIINIILDTSYPVPYQASLNKSEDGTFDKATREMGLKVFKEIKNIADQQQVKKIVAVATSAFRKANNAKEFVAEISRETAITVRIIPQREEGEIAYYSAIALGTFDPNNVVVWDIGTGSLQMTVKNAADGLSVYMGERMGSVEFKNYVIAELEELDLDVVATPNPIDEKVLKLADSYVRAFGRKAYPIIKEKIGHDATILGIGRLFYNSIRPLASENGVITRKALRAYISSSLNKTDEELNNPYAQVDVTNCILTLAIMKALHIHEIIPVDTTSTKGILVYPSYWEAEEHISS